MAKNRVKVPAHTRSDGTKVKAYIRRGPGSETYGQGYYRDKKNKLLIKRQSKRR